MNKRLFALILAGTILMFPVNVTAFWDWFETPEYSLLDHDVDFITMLNIWGSAGALITLNVTNLIVTNEANISILNVENTTVTSINVTGNISIEKPYYLIGANITSPDTDIGIGANVNLMGNNLITTGTVQGVTQAEFNTLTDNSIANALHRHTELVASDGSPDPALSVDEVGRVGIGTSDPEGTLELRTGNSIMRIRDTGDTATATTSYVEFGGTTASNWNRTGYVGDTSSGDTNIRLRAEQGNLVLGDSSGVSVLTLQDGNVTITGTITASLFQAENIDRRANFLLDGNNLKLWLEGVAAGTNWASIIFDYDSSGDTIFHNEMNSQFAFETGAGEFLRLSSSIFSLGIPAADVDVTMNFLAASNSGQFKWMEDEDYFQFADGMLIASGENISFRDVKLSIGSLDDGHLDLAADTSIDLNTPLTVTAGTVQAEHLYSTDDALIDDDFRVDGQFSMNTAPAADNLVKLVMASTDVMGIHLEQTTNDYSVSSSALSYGLRIVRHIDVGTGEFSNPYGLHTTVVHKSSNAKLVTNSKGLFVAVFRADNDGKRTNELAADRVVYDNAFWLTLDDDGSYDTTSTGKITHRMWGSQVKINNDATYADTGGNAPASRVEGIGYNIDMDILPVLDGGDPATITMVNKGINMNVFSNAIGTSTNYGIYIGRVDGADTNWAIYDASGKDWALDADNQKILLGEGQDASIYYDAADLIINPKEVGSGGLKVLGDANITGNLTYTAIYAQLSDPNDQVFAVINTPYPINVSTVDEINGLGHSVSNITIYRTGVYNIAAQPQVSTGAGGAGKFHMWLQKWNTTHWLNVSNSNVELVLASNEENVIPLITTLKLEANEKIRVMGSVSDDAIELDAQTPANEPAIPSIIFTMYKIGN